MELEEANLTPYQKEIEKIIYEGNLQAEIMVLLIKKDKDTATENIVGTIMEHNHIYTTRDDEKSEMWIYREGIYVPQAKTYIKEFCRRVLLQAYTSQLGNRVIAKIETDTYIEQEEFFQNINIEEIAIENGILNIITRQLNPFTPDKIFFNKLPIKYNPKAECPTIKKHFETVLKYEDDVPVLEELFGYLLLREYRLETAFMFIGPGRNGKSKTLELMKRFVGVENCSSIPLQQFEEDNFAMGELFNKMANVAGDLDRKALTHTGAFKTLTGRDLISAARKFLTRVKFINYAKLIFACNELPLTYDLTHAFWERWIVLEFPYTFVTSEELEEKTIEEQAKCKLKDPNIIQKLATEEELSGLLNIALNGLGRISNNNAFSYSKNTEEVQKLWLRKSSSFNAFLMDHIEMDWDSSLLKTRLRKAYSKYCRKYKLKGISDKFVKDILATNLGVTDDRETFDKVQKPVWVGIKLKNEEEISYEREEFHTIGEKVISQYSIESSPLASFYSSFNEKQKKEEEEGLDSEKE